MVLVAHEPQVTSPVDACFDEFGRMYIAEFRGYPYSEEARQPQQPEPIGKKDACRVRRLEDKDGDGQFETSVIFADGLSWVISVCCYDGGVFVLAPSKLFYMKDTDGDGRADDRRVVLTGFSRDNPGQLITPGFRCGRSPVSSSTRMAASTASTLVERSPFSALYPATSA